MLYDMIATTRFWKIPNPSATKRRNSRAGTDQHTIRFRAYDRDGRFYGLGTTRPENILIVKARIEKLHGKDIILRTYWRKSCRFLTVVEVMSETELDRLEREIALKMNRRDREQ